MSLALVADVGLEARVAVHHVLDLLQAAVGQVVVVESFGEIAITAFSVAEVVAIVVLDLVVEVVPGLLRFVGFVRLVGPIGALRGRRKQ